MAQARPGNPSTLTDNKLQKHPVSVVIPVFNEEAVIEKTIRGYHNEVLGRLPGSEMIVVDDCSTDSTPLILKRLAEELSGISILRPPRNVGHGKALRLAFENANREIVFHTDSDYQFDPGDFGKLYTESAENDLVIGYRADRQDPAHRLAITNVLRLLNFLMFGINLQDANSPFKIVRMDCLNECLVHIDPDAFAPSIMLAITARHKGFRVKEIPVTHYPRKSGKTSIEKRKLVKILLRCFVQNIKLKIALMYEQSRA